MAQNQEQIEARLAAYIDGELDANERAEIEKHLANNPQHRQLIDELMGQRDFLKALPREKAPPEIAETIHSQLERSVLLGKAGEDTEAAALRINRWPHRGAIAAIVLLTAGLGFLVYKVLPSNKPPAEFAVAPRELSPATAPLTEEEKAEKPTEVATAEKLAERSISAPTAATATPAPTPSPSVTPEPAPAPSVALTPAPAITPSPAVTPEPAPAPSVALAPAPAPTPAPAPERISKTGDTTDIAAATPPASTPPPSPSAAPPISIGVDTLPGTVPPAGAPTTPTADAGNKEDQGKIAAPTPDALAMKNGAVFNDAAAGNQPLANAMKSGGDLRKAGEVNAVGGFGGGGGGAGQQQFGAALASSNGSITLVVSTDDPSLAGEQVKSYCADNGIAWEPTPAPASIAYAQQDYTRMNRLRSQQVTVSSGQPMAKGMADEKYRYPAKDVGGNRRIEMQSLDRGGALSDEANAKKEPATQPSLTDTDAIAKQSAPNSSVGATTQPVTGAQQAQTRDDVAAEHMAYFCRSVTPEQAHELEGVLSARPGQSAQVLPQSLAVDRTLDLNVQAGAMPTTAPSTQPTAGPIALNEQPAAPSDGSTMKDQLAVPADKLGNGNANGNFDLKQGPAQQQQHVAQQPALEQRVDLLVVVQREISAATQPTQQQLESPPVNAAEPVRQEPPTKSP